jgi:hypothetical protein
MANTTTNLLLPLSTLGDSAFKRSYRAAMALIDAAIGTVYTASATVDPTSLVDAAGLTGTVTVTGATMGDFVTLSFDKDLAGITLTGYVSVANTVAYRFQNESGGTLDLASGTLRVRVRKH